VIDQVRAAMLYLGGFLVSGRLEGPVIVCCPHGAGTASVPSNESINQHDAGDRKSAVAERAPVV